MKKSLFLILGIAIILLGVTEVVVWHKLKTAQSVASSTEKAYVAAENDGEIDVVDTSLKKVVKRISLTLEDTPQEISYMPHNVQVSPKGDQVWVTANSMATGHKMSWLERWIFPKAYAHGDDSQAGPGKDQVVVIDADTDKIIKRIDIGEAQHLAHVVFTPDSQWALVTAQVRGAIYKISTTTLTVNQTLLTPNKSQPHGLRISPDGSTAYIAMNGSNSLGILDIPTFQIHYVPLIGSAVQTGVSPNGNYAFVTIFDKKSLAVYDTHSKRVKYISLPATAKGPIQLYPTPDSRFVYVADQGYYASQPQGNQLYKIDVGQSKVVAITKLGTAPHGVVVSPDGKLVFVTNLLSNNVSVVDVASNREITKIPVGQAPNGISLRTKVGGTP